MSMLTHAREAARRTRNISPERTRSLNSSLAWLKPYVGAAAGILFFTLIALAIIASKTAIVLSRMHW